MGEVYRADDLVLGQPVALKFLPEAANKNQDLLARFRNEVRTARRVSNPNVCRVYDVGEVDGQTFLSMEYVDGEDLASLLRRIGRLPEDKAVETARQLCAGLGAAHKEGVLHRDLKPANIMLDGRGHAIITDFGLAGLAGDLQGADVRSGTPAYMAPEQLAGREVTAKSDLYSLGLVLYEIFTGKRAFEADTLAELVRVRNEKPLGKPSSWVKDLDPAVERVIMRCLEQDPAARPSSALAVAAALPGGDPLAAALAAGETPSPELVAAAGETEGLKPRVALAYLVAVVAGIIVAAILGARINLLDQVHPPFSGEVLAQRAQDILNNLGYSERPVDTAYDFSFDWSFQQYVEKNDKPKPRWNEIITGSPALLCFWYRQSPDYLYATDFVDQELTPGIVTTDDPPRTLSGMIYVDLDYKGRLIYLEAITPQLDEHPQPAKPADWKPLFSAAGLDPAQFQAAQPIWNSLAASDERVAWTGMWPGTARPLRVEAAAWRGKPVYFSLIGPWKKPNRMHQDDSSGANKAANIINLIMGLSILLVSALLARRAFAQGKGDRQGAFRIACLIFVSNMTLWLCRSHIAPTAGTFGHFFIATSTALYWACLMWLIYMAVEPYVRRHWPQAIISWSRLLTGRLRDPVVGRDLLFGVVLGLVWVLIFQSRYVLMEHMGASPATGLTDFLLGTRRTLGAWLMQVPSSIRTTLVFFFVLFLLRALLRKQWLAVVVFVAIWAGIPSLQSRYPVIEVPVFMLVYGIAALAVVRFGLVTLAVGVFTADVILNLPFTLDLSAWYASSSIFVLMTILLLAAWGFYTSLAGQKLLKDDLFQ